MNHFFASHSLVCALVLSAPVAAWATKIPTVPVGNVDNGDDSTGFGGVSYA